MNWSKKAKMLTTRTANDTGTLHFYPRAAVDPTTGAIGIAWYDTKDDPTGANKLTDVYAAGSVDKGLSWSAPVRVTGDLSDASKSDPVNFLDYMGASFAGGIFCPTWADNSF